MGLGLPGELYVSGWWVRDMVDSSGGLDPFLGVLLSC